MDPQNPNVLGGVPLNLVYQAMGMPVPTMPAPPPSTNSADQTGAPTASTASTAPAVPMGPMEAYTPSFGMPEMPEPQVGGSVSSGQGVSAGMSQSGFDAAKADQIAQRAARRGGIDQQLQDISDAQNANLTGLAHTGDRVAAEGKQAIDQQTQAEREKIAAEGRENADLATMNQNMAAEESRQSALAAQKVQQQMANYEAALNDFRAAQVDPGQLWHSLGTGDKVGMLATAFVHDFLGVRGIHTSAMETFNRAVDQNIASQIENIKKKGEVAQGFKQLYDMAQQQSMSDRETRLRVRGYMLESFKAKVMSELSGYDSQLAAAKGEAAKAAVDGELLKTKTDLSKIWQDNANSQKAVLVKKYGDELQASASRYAANMAANSRQGMDLGKAEELTRSVNRGAVRDPETGEVVGIADEEKGYGEATEAMAKAQDLAARVRNYVGLLKQVGTHYRGPGADKLNPADALLVDSARKELASYFDSARAGARGAASIDVINYYGSLFSEPNLSTVDSLQKAIGTASQLAQTGRSDARSRVSIHLRQPTELEKQFLGQGIPGEPTAIGANAQPPTAFGKASATEINAERKTKGEISETRVDQLDKEITSDRGRRQVNFFGTTDETQKVWAALHPELATDAEGNISHDALDTKIPAWTDNMAALWKIAAHPQLFTPQEVQQATERLTHYATAAYNPDPSARAKAGQEGVDDVTPEMSHYAQYLLLDLTSMQNGTYGK